MFASWGSLGSALGALLWRLGGFLSRLDGILGRLGAPWGRIRAPQDSPPGGGGIKGKGLPFDSITTHDLDFDLSQRGTPGMEEEIE